MTSTSEQRRAYSGISLFSFGFRPFFLGGAAVAALVPPVTALSLGGITSTGAVYGPIPWHGHEMVFGYLGAVVSGFILTAVPNWTGRLPVLGLRLMALFGLWLAGRLAILISGTIGAGAAAAIDAPFLVIMAGVIWREVMTGGNWRNLPVCVLITMFAAGNLTWHLDVLDGGTGAFGSRLGIAVIAVLLSLIGGRITPSFTRNWLVKEGRDAPDISVSRVDRAALAAIILAVSLWLWLPENVLSGTFLIIAAVLHLFRLLRWQGWRTGAEPLVTILHAGYLWLPVSLVLLGVASIDAAMVTPSIAMHALTAGAAGVMTLAVMTRATRGHTGRELQADAVTVVMYVLVNLGAIVRMAAGLLPAHYMTMIAIAAVMWSGAFALFVAVYGRYLIAPRPRTVNTTPT